MAEPYTDEEMNERMNRFRAFLIGNDMHGDFLMTFNFREPHQSRGWGADPFHLDEIEARRKIYLVEQDEDDEDVFYFWALEGEEGMEEEWEYDHWKGVHTDLAGGSALSDLQRMIGRLKEAVGISDDDDEDEDEEPSVYTADLSDQDAFFGELFDD